VLKNKLEALPAFQAVSDDSNGLELLRLIKGIAYQFSSQKKISHAIYDSIH
jgi:hypothetical protein